MTPTPSTEDPHEPEQPREHTSPRSAALHQPRVLEALAAMFPPEPEDFVCGNDEAFETAHREWVETCTTLAAQAGRLPELLERLKRAEQGRDAILDVLDRYRLPAEPRREDYVPSAEDIAAGGEPVAWESYAQDHARWRDLVAEAVTARELALWEVAHDAGPRTAYLPPQFQHEWVPRDLIAVTTLQALLAADPEVVGPILIEEHREHLMALLEAADVEVRIPDPDDPDGPEVYEGPASQAHRWIDPGIYPATGLDGEGQFRVVVSPTSSGSESGASAAFPPAEHDSRILDQIGHLLEHAPEQPDSGQLMADISTLVVSTGRIGLDPDQMTGPGGPVGDVLGDRAHEMGDDDPPQPEPGREDPGLSR